MPMTAAEERQSEQLEQFILDEMKLLGMSQSQAYTATLMVLLHILEKKINSHNYKNPIEYVVEWARLTYETQEAIGDATQKLASAGMIKLIKESRK